MFVVVVCTFGDFGNVETKAAQPPLGIPGPTLYVEFDFGFEIFVVLVRALLLPAYALGLSPDRLSLAWCTRASHRLMVFRCAVMIYLEGRTRGTLNLQWWDISCQLHCTIKDRSNSHSLSLRKFEYKFLGSTPGQGSTYEKLERTFFISGKFMKNGELGMKYSVVWIFEIHGQCGRKTLTNLAKTPSYIYHKDGRRLQRTNKQIQKYLSLVNSLPGNRTRTLSRRKHQRFKRMPVYREHLHVFVHGRKQSGGRGETGLLETYVVGSQVGEDLQGFTYAPDPALDKIPPYASYIVMSASLLEVMPRCFAERAEWGFTKLKK
ncbi:hypothetical protein BDZ94DRAFT_1237538 [Collybia nuda]|uniref:Uncharacterized protein n=1 Tax=Collybia nuda TaxID=64659 RepID=A0A9P5Y3L8_9AGAR|nr:hypothetical protein BDZ94DRAFT_1237538 [Collybia nuda]